MSRPYAITEPHTFRTRLRFQALRRASRRSPPRWLNAQDVRDFLLAYCACFMAVTAFIA